MLESDKAERALAALETIATELTALRACLCEDKPKPPKSGKVLATVPWLSQLGRDAAFAPGDCGPACAAMWIRYYGSDAPTVDECSQAINLPPGYKYTTPAHIMNIMRHYGFETYWRRLLSLDDLRAEIDRAHPMILLVEYDRLPYELRYDKAYKYGHWILIVGYYEDDEDGDVFVYHDPYYLDSAGAFVTIRADDLFIAWNSNSDSGNSNRQAIRVN